MRLKTLDVLVAVGFVMAYVTLDRISFVHPVAGVGITPWNPQTGLAVAFALHIGTSASIPILLAPICADLLTRGAHVPPALSIAISLSSGTIYLLSWTAIRRYVFYDHFSVKRLRDLVTFFAMSSISAALVAISSVLLYTVTGLIPEAQVRAAILSQWIGDWIGIAIAVPFIFQLLDWKLLPRLSAGMLVHFGMLLLTLVVVLGGGPQMRTSLFYLLFLPVVAVAVACP